MGWTEYHAEHYKKGKVDRKAELDVMYIQEEHDAEIDGKVVHYSQFRVLKSGFTCCWRSSGAAAQVKTVSRRC